MPLTLKDEARVRKHSLHIKHGHQLDAMLVSHTSKLDRLREPGGDLEKHTQDTDGMAAVKWELRQRRPDLNPGQLLQEFFDQQLFYIKKDSILQEIVDIIPVEINARANGIVHREPIGTTYYIDATNGTDSYTGTKITGTIDSSADSTHFVDAALTGADDYINNSFFYNETTGAGTLISDFVAATDTVTLTDADASMAAGDTYYILHAWADLDQFTENARSAGDICILRRGMTGYDDGTDLEFTSDGTLAAPITVRSDNANNWRDNVDLSGTGTATITVGSKVWTFSADVSSVVSAGDVLYEVNDDADLFAYEVDTVSTVTVTMFLPYKGGNDGSGKTVTNLQSNPVWNTAAGDFQWHLSLDDFWNFQGIHVRGTDGQGTIEIDSARMPFFRDMVIEGNGSGDTTVSFSDDWIVSGFLRCRFYNYFAGLFASGGVGAMSGIVKDCLFDGQSISVGYGMNTSTGQNISVEESEFKNHDAGDIKFSSSVSTVGVIRTRNCILSSTTEVDSHHVSPGGAFFSEDHDGTIGDTRQLNSLSQAEGTPIIQSDTGTVRSGGGAISGKCTGSDDLNTTWPHSRQLLFEIPFYATTTSKKYEVFFRPTATADWTADPTASELWIELEAWGHATNNFRQITKSTGVIDMNGSTTFTALDVTVAPAQAGVAYLRGYYAKPKESTKANTFFWDVVPVVT